MALTTDDIIWLVIAWFLPPLGVYLKLKQCNGVVCCNVVLTLFFWLPGFIHAVIVICK